MTTKTKLAATNTSGVQGISLNKRKGYLVLDVTWNDRTRSQPRRCTSYPVGNSPLKAVQTAMTRRVVEAGAVYELSPQAAWSRLKASRPDLVAGKHERT